MAQNHISLVIDQNTVKADKLPAWVKEQTGVTLIDLVEGSLDKLKEDTCEYVLFLTEQCELESGSLLSAATAGKGQRLIALNTAPAGLGLGVYKISAAESGIYDFFGLNSNVEIRPSAFLIRKDAVDLEKIDPANGDHSVWRMIFDLIREAEGRVFISATETMTINKFKGQMSREQIDKLAGDLEALCRDLEAEHIAVPDYLLRMIAHRAARIIENKGSLDPALARIFAHLPADMVKKQMILNRDHSELLIEEALEMRSRALGLHTEIRRRGFRTVQLIFDDRGQVIEKNPVMSMGELYLTVDKMVFGKKLGLSGVVRGTRCFEQDDLTFYMEDTKDRENRIPVKTEVTMKDDYKVYRIKASLPGTKGPGKRVFRLCLESGQNEFGLTTRAKMDSHLTYEGEIGGRKHFVRFTGGRVNISEFVEQIQSEGNED